VPFTLTVALPPPLALSILGLVWGIVYVWHGTQEAQDWYEVAFMFVNPYADLMEDPGFTIFCRTLFIAIPFNIMVAWGIAGGVAILVTLFLNASYDGIAYIVLALLTIVEFLWYNSEYLLIY